MYQITLVNHSDATLTTSDGKSVHPNDTWQSESLGNAWVKSDQIGTLNFLDIGDQHIGGNTKETWGVLISYQGEEIVGRYEGGGQLKVTLNKFLQAHLSGMNLRRVQLPAMEIDVGGGS
jgi:hypothetical protein